MFERIKVLKCTNARSVLSSNIVGISSAIHQTAERTVPVERTKSFTALFINPPPQGSRPFHDFTWTIPDNLLSCEWGQAAGMVSEVIPTTGRTLDVGFVNSAVTMLFIKLLTSGFWAVA